MPQSAKTEKRELLKLLLMNTVPCVLAIGGTDPSGGAGLPADARAAAAFGAHLCGVVTAIVAQNTRGVAHLEAVEAALIAAQLDNILEDIEPRAVKIGLLPHAAAVHLIAERLRRLPGVPVVLDTVFAPSHGPRFSDEDTVEAIAEHLMPLCEIVTPNLLEAAILCGQTLRTWPEVRAAAALIHQKCGAQHVLLKGGHWNENEADAVDLFSDGHDLIELRAPRLAGYEVRGTGCLLASAIAAQRAADVAPLEAARRAKAWLTQQIAGATIIGGGRRVAALPAGTQLTAENKTQSRS